MSLNISAGGEDEGRDATESSAAESNAAESSPPGSNRTEPTQADAPPADPNSTETSPRDQLIAEVVNEMTSWNAKDRMKAFRTWLKGSLSLIHLHVLTVLEADAPIAMSRLADTLDVSVASATGIIGRMEERGLVERRHDREDRRVVLVAATDAGKNVFHTMGEERRNQLRMLLGRLTDDELAALRTGLRAIRTARESLHAEHEADR